MSGKREVMLREFIHRTLWDPGSLFSSIFIIGRVISIWMRSVPIAECLQVNY